MEQSLRSVAGFAAAVAVTAAVLLLTASSGDREAVRIVDAVVALVAAALTIGALLAARHRRRAQGTAARSAVEPSDLRAAEATYSNAS